MNAAHQTFIQPDPEGKLWLKEQELWDRAQHNE
jgi:hypothetical protein